MPRHARIGLCCVPMHIIHRGNNREASLFDDEDYLASLQWLGEYANESGVHRVHVCARMTNHVHLLLTPCRLGRGTDEASRSALRAVHQPNAAAQRHAAGGAVSLVPDTRGRLSSGATGISN